MKSLWWYITRMISSLQSRCGGMVPPAVVILLVGSLKHLSRKFQVSWVHFFEPIHDKERLGNDDRSRTAATHRRRHGCWWKQRGRRGRGYHSDSRLGSHLDSLLVLFLLAVGVDVMVGMWWLLTTEGSWWLRGLPSPCSAGRNTDVGLRGSSDSLGVISEDMGEVMIFYFSYRS